MRRARLRCRLLSNGFYYFVDVRESKFYRIKPGEKAELLRENTGEGNGTTFDPQGRLIQCEGGNRRVTRWPADGMFASSDVLTGCGKTLARTGIDLILCCRSIEEAATDAWQGPREWQAVQLRQRGEPGPTRPPVAGDPGTGERGAGASVAWVCGTVCR